LVRGAYMVQERKASSGLSNLISAENSLNLNMKIFICIAGRGSWIS
jgi:hypothetical protein